MTLASFAYARPETIEQAIELLVEHGDQGRLLAGGHSLLPLMKLRALRPSVLIDLAGVSGLDYIRTEGGQIVIGAMTRQADLETSVLIRAAAPLLSHVAGTVGDCQVRHRGTLGGSLAHAQSSADPAVALMALRATIIVAGQAGRREIPIDDFYVGSFRTALAPDEVVIEVRLRRADGRPWGFLKFRRRAIDPAIVGVAYQGEEVGGAVGLSNMGPTTLRAMQAEDALREGASRSEVAALADADTDPPGDASASPEYRRHLARILLRRAMDGQAGS